MQRRDVTEVVRKYRICVKKCGWIAQKPSIVPLWPPTAEIRCGDCDSETELITKVESV